MVMSRLGYCKYLQSGGYTKDREFLDPLYRELLHMLNGTLSRSCAGAMRCKLYLFILSMQMMKSAQSKSCRVIGREIKSSVDSPCAVQLSLRHLDGDHFLLLRCLFQQNQH